MHLPPTRTRVSRRGRRLAIALSATLLLAPLAPAAASPEQTGFSPGAPILWQSDSDVIADLDAMRATGARWLRVDVDWSLVEAQQGTYDWSVPDRVIDAARAWGFDVIAMPTYTPDWARPAGTSDKWGPDPTKFAAFAGAAARHYAANGVHVFEIWNEPNIVTFWEPKPDPEAYAELLRRAAAEIRKNNPHAFVLTGGTSPQEDRADGLTFSQITWLQRLYAAGVKHSFDAVAVHPYTYPLRPMEASSWNPLYNLPSLRELMVAQGDAAKKVWGTEYGAPTGTSERAVSESQQAEHLLEAYAAWNGWNWTGPLLWYAHRDHGTDLSDTEQNFGLLRHDRSRKPAFEVFRQVVGASSASHPAPATPHRGAPRKAAAPATSESSPDGDLFPAKLEISRSGVLRGRGALDVLAPITKRASGRVQVDFQAAGRHTRFTAPVDEAEGHVRFRQPIPHEQAERGTGIVSLTYPGNERTHGQKVRLRAAPGRARLELDRPSLRDGRLRARGSISGRARGVVRVQLSWATGGQSHSLELQAPIRSGRWMLDKALPAAAVQQIAQRDGTVHSNTLFTGYLPAQMRGEMRAYQVLAAP